MMPASGVISHLRHGAPVYKDGVYKGAMADQVGHSQ